MKKTCPGPALLQKVGKAEISEIEECLKYIENINYQDSKGNSALSLAVTGGDYSVFQQVIAAGPDPLVNGPGDVSMARLAKMHKNHELLPQLKRYQLLYWDSLNYPFTQDNLIICIEQDNTLILRRFINRGFVMDSAVIGSIKPITLAALNGSSDVVDLLIGLGIDPDSEFDTRSVLSIAAMYGYADIARTLIDAQADINNYDGAHTTALMFAAENNHLSTVKMLLDAGANANLDDKNGETAMDKARKKGYNHVVSLLLADGY